MAVEKITRTIPLTGLGVRFLVAVKLVTGEFLLNKQEPFVDVATHLLDVVAVTPVVVDGHSGFREVVHLRRCVVVCMCP
jgi:UTP-glucose-1-phosphate uridylyltransferase